MMKLKIEASALFVSLILISSLLAFIFMTKEVWLNQENAALYYYKRYLSDKFLLKEQLAEGSDCVEYKANFVEKNLGYITYHYQCEKQSLFIQKPTKEKYIAFTDIQDWLALDKFQSEIYYIRSLKELPPSSEQDPKIVIAQNRIDEKIEENFYGIIITQDYFDITGTKKIYGTLYSGFDNEREERNLTFKRSVIDNLDQKYSIWRELPYTRNILNDP